MKKTRSQEVTAQTIQGEVSSTVAFLTQTVEFDFRGLKGIRR